MSSAFQLRQAVQCCHSGGVIAYPTEAVFGLGCDPLDELAVDRILSLKQRSKKKGLILIASSIDQLGPFMAADQALDRLEQAPSQPTSWLVKASALTPDWITGNHSKLAVRITQHPVACELCRQLGYPLVSTSANPAGLAPARTAFRVRHYFNNRIDFCLNGAVGDRQKPSRIKDLETGKVFREG